MADGTADLHRLLSHWTEGSLEQQCYHSQRACKASSTAKLVPSCDLHVMHAGQANQHPVEKENSQIQIIF